MRDIPTVVFHDSALQLISEQVAAHPPERGGLLVGPRGVPVVSDFLVDHHAAATGVTFRLSRESERRLHEYEGAGHQLKGVLHSHPSGLPHPSSGDEETFAAQLRRMPHLPYLITPIITQTSGRALDHQISLPPRGVMSVFTAVRTASRRARIEPAPASVLPVKRVLADLAEWGATLTTTRSNYLALNGQQYAGVSLSLSNGQDGIVLLPPGYPVTAPILLVGGVHVPLLWDLGVDEDKRLEVGLAAAVIPVVNGTVVGNPKAQRSRNEGSDTGAGSTIADQVRAGLRARLDGTVAASVTGKRVLVVGLGSGGSQTVEALVRASVEQLTLVDPDCVEAANLSRSVYTAADVGISKVAAIARHASDINPGVRIVSYRRALNEFAADELADLVASVDLVVAATDDPDAQYRLNRVTYHAGKFAVFAGVYERGSAGEVVFTVPGVTACFRCATGGKRGGSRGTAALNYGTGTLVAEPALGADITHVVSASVKIIIGLLELTDRDAREHSSQFMVADALGKHANFLQLAMVANYPGFGKLFRGVPAQHAYQSMWIETRIDPECPVCGDDPEPDAVPEALDVAALADEMALGTGLEGHGEFVDFEGEFAATLTEMERSASDQDAAEPRPESGTRVDQGDS